MPDNPTIDQFGRDYLRLVLEINKHIDGYIDAYYGPEDIKLEVQADRNNSPSELLAALHSLQDRVPSHDPARQAFLAASLRSIETTIYLLDGKKVDYLDEVALLYDIRPSLINETDFEGTHRDLDLLLPEMPGQGLGDRLVTWRKQYEITGEAVLQLLELARLETRFRTVKMFDLPPGESVDIRLTCDQPWGAYNWYLGSYHSLIEFNTDIPIQIQGLLDTFAHEAYPGHHTEHLLKEQVLYRERGYAERAAVLLHSPTAVISEGIATMAQEIIFPYDTAYVWMAERLFPAAGLPADENQIRQMRKISEALKPMRAVTANAAILFHTGQLSEAQAVDYIQTYGLVTRQRAEKSFRFLSHSLFRSYIFTYTIGYDLIAGTPDRVATFRRLLTDQVLPSQLQIQD
ncbi:MAG: hypothetical protein R6X18_12800 [Chloroflexota bacterium]